MTERAVRPQSQDDKPGLAERWRQAVVPADASVQQVIHSLETSALQIVLVVGPDGTLVGTVTDGDIRRGLLRGLTLGSRVTSIIKRDPLVVPPEIGRETVLQLM